MTVRDRAARTALRATDVVLLTLGNATYLARPGGGTFCCCGGVPASDYEVRGQSVAEIRDDLEHIHLFTMIPPAAPARSSTARWPASTAGSTSGARGARGC